MLKEEKRFAHGCVFEGMISISAVLNSQSTDRRVLRVLFDRGRIDKKEKEHSYLKKAAVSLGFDIEYVTSTQLDELTVGSTHGGIAAVCSDRTIAALNERHIRDGGFYVCIEGIEDPYNFGYALRSLYAAGADGVVLSPRNWMSAAGVVCRASAGASELMELYTGGEDMLDIFRSRGYRIICADTENASSIYSTSMKKPLLLVIGGEKRGISRKILEQGDAVVRLEYGRFFGEALSAASAASVLAFEVLRQNRS